MKKKPQLKKCKTEKAKKSIKVKRITPICFSVNVHNCNSNTMYNHNKQKNRQPPPPPQIKPGESCIPKPCPDCIPRKGELVINGGFENEPETFLGWIINAGAGAIQPHLGDIPHQGLQAARLGAACTRGLIYQDVPGICPGLFYQLNFFLSAATDCGNASVLARLEYLDHNKNKLNQPALNILVPENSLTNQSYTFFINATQEPAPPDTKFARISFIANVDEYAEQVVHLDDVSLIAI